jgi:hypothetical protein
MRNPDKRKKCIERCRQEAAKQLGEKFSIARHKLNRQIFFSLIQKLGLNVCYRCQRAIENYYEVSIDHKEPWLHKENAVDLFYNLENIAFSHRRCNSKYFRFGKLENNSGYRGVYKTRDNRWYAKSGKNLGTFQTKEEAAHAYDKYVIETQGDRAALNFPDFDYSNYVPQRIFKVKKYKYRGVHFDKSRNKFVATYYLGNQKSKFIGRFDTEEETAKAYNKYVIDHKLQGNLNEV